MEPGRQESLKIRIQRGDTHELSTVTEELIRDAQAGNTWPRELLGQLAERASMRFVPGMYLAQAVIAVDDPQFYRAVAPSLQHWSDAILLLQHGVPDPAIEKRLCEVLEDARSSEVHSMIVRALGEHGTLACLRALQRLEYDCAPGRHVAQVGLESMDAITHEAPEPNQVIRRLDYVSAIHLHKMVVQAIEQVRVRDKHPRCDWAEPTTAQDLSIFADADRHFGRCKWHLQSNELVAAMNELRSATEALLKALIKSRAFPGVLPQGVRDSDVDVATLEKLCNWAYQVGVPKQICGLASTIQGIANLAAHHQSRFAHDELLDRMTVDGQVAIWQNARRLSERELARRFSGSRPT